MAWFVCVRVCVFSDWVWADRLTPLGPCVRLTRRVLLFIKKLCVAPLIGAGVRLYTRKSDRLYTRGSSVHAASVCGVPKQCGHTLGSYGRRKGRVLIQGAQMCV